MDLSVSDWQSLGIADPIAKLLRENQLDTPTEIQARSIPIALAGQDVLASAETGSGKTAAFSLPIIQKFMGRKGTMGLVVTPTRELALQVHETIEKLGAPVGVKSTPLIGGVDIKADETALSGGSQILVGTPGRLCDHLARGNLWLEYIEVLVLDEADRMLDMGFQKELDRIIGDLKTDRQTLLFSATFPEEIQRLARKILVHPEKILLGKPMALAEGIEHELLWIREDDKKRELLSVIQRESGSIIVFTRTKDGAAQLYRSIHAKGVHDSTYIASNRRQMDREEALEGFRSGKYRVLIATDVAGRGIHVDDVSLVVNYDLPRDPKDYVHRVGRTGRHDAEGFATSFATERDRQIVSQIERILGETIPSRTAKGFSHSYSGGYRGKGRSGASNVTALEPARRQRRPSRGGGGGRKRAKPSRRRSTSSYDDAPSERRSSRGGSRRGEERQSRSSRSAGRPSRSASSRRRPSDDRRERSSERSESRGRTEKRSSRERSTSRRTSSRDAPRSSSSRRTRSDAPSGRSGESRHSRRDSEGRSARPRRSASQDSGRGSGRSASRSRSGQGRTRSSLSSRGEARRGSSRGSERPSSRRSSSEGRSSSRGRSSGNDRFSRTGSRRESSRSGGPRRSTRSRDGGRGRSGR